MRAIRLKELDRESPVCASFDDEEAVRRYEREVREHRAYTEPYQVTPLDEQIDGAYQVESASGVSYLVDIVDGSGENDGCSCPDFLTGGLGTCKHLEAVRRAIISNRARRRLFERLPSSPTQPVLAVHGVGEPSLVALGPWHRRAPLRRLGFATSGDDEVRLPAGFDLATLAPAVRVTHGAAAWRATLLRRSAVEERVQRIGRALRRFPTDLLTRPLFPYQREGVRHLLGRGRALLADDMGLGKTVQAIAACETLFTLGEARSVLIVCPASLKAQWASEILRYTGKDAVVIGGASSQRRQQLRSDAAYKVMNYEVTWRELDLLRELDADVLILDEAQRAKNFRTKTAATLRQLPSRFLFVLTGTPIENRLDDLYSLMQIVEPRLLGPLWRFNFDFHEQGRNGKILAYKNLGALRERIAPAVLRRRKEEVLTQLPPITFQTRYTPLSPGQLALEDEYRTRAARLARQAEHRPLTREETQRLLAYLLKARQACDAAELCDPKTEAPGSPKLDEFEGLVAEIGEQGTAKILVFSEWVEMLKLAAQRLRKLGIGYAMLHGGIPTERRPALIEKFRADPGVRVLLSSDAGGSGLNLQVASYILHLDLPWNPARLDQRTARAHRLGQTRGVTVIHLCSESGIERGIEGTLATKRQVRTASLEMDADVDTIEAPSFRAFLGQLRDTLQTLDAVPVSAPASEVVGPDDPTAVAPDASVEPPSLPAEEVGASEPSLPPEALADATSPADELAPVDDASLDPTVHPDTSNPERAYPEVPEMEPVAPPAPTSLPAGAPLVADHAPPAPANGDAAPRPAGGRPPRERLRLARVLLGEGFAAESVQATYESLASAILGRATTASPLRPSVHQHAALVAFIYRELLPGGLLPRAATGALARLHDLTSLSDHDVEVDRETAHEAITEAEGWIERLASP